MSPRQNKPGEMIWDRLYGLHREALERRAFLQEQFRREEEEKERSIRYEFRPPCLVTQEEVEASTQRLLYEAVEKRKARQKALLEVRDKELEGLFRPTLRKGAKRPVKDEGDQDQDGFRGEALYQLAARRKEHRDKEVQAKQERELQLLQEKSVHRLHRSASTGCVQSTTNRLFSDAEQRTAKLEQVREAKEQREVEAFESQILHRDRSRSAGRVASRRLYQDHVKRLEKAATATTTSAISSAQPAPNQMLFANSPRAGTQSYLHRLYDDGLRRNKDKEQRREDYLRQEEEELQANSVHAEAQKKRQWKASDLRRLGDHMHRKSVGNLWRKPQKQRKVPAELDEEEKAFSDPGPSLARRSIVQKRQSLTPSEITDRIMLMAASPAEGPPSPSSPLTARGSSELRRKTFASGLSSGRLQDGDAKSDPGVVSGRRQTTMVRLANGKSAGDAKSDPGSTTAHRRTIIGLAASAGAIANATSTTTATQRRQSSLGRSNVDVKSDPGSPSSKHRASVIGRKASLAKQADGGIHVSDESKDPAKRRSTSTPTLGRRSQVLCEESPSKEDSELSSPSQARPGRNAKVLLRPQLRPPDPRRKAQIDTSKSRDQPQSKGLAKAKAKTAVAAVKKKAAEKTGPNAGNGFLRRQQNILHLDSETESNDPQL
eukprot:TRINITY_DN3026_c0_g1_i2.p1 TRINITY_DN3026_c0_g1~~TRINITY_DN3026_c0_g1_i2.p1  ORF type:complete len:660 (-),score=138.66 TRINITY_DN3026_c0_g1_i2:76-2055(-)